MGQWHHMSLNEFTFGVVAMKKCCAMILAAAWLLLGCGCMSIYHPTTNLSENLSDEIVSQLLDAATSGDIEAIVSLFAPNALQETGDLAQDAAAFAAYLQGTQFAFEREHNIVEKSWNYGTYRQEEQTCYAITSEMQTYRLAMLAITHDDEKPDDVGIWSLSLIRSEDDPCPERTYAGDCLFHSGIFLDAACAPVILGNHEKAGEISLQTVTTLLDAVGRNDRESAKALFAKEGADFDAAWETLVRYFGDGYTALTLEEVHSARSGPDEGAGEWNEIGDLSFLATTARGNFSINVTQEYYNTTNADTIGLHTVNVE